MIELPMDSHFSKILLDRYRDGDSAAALEIYSRYAQRLFALTRTRIGKQLKSKIDPEDIAQSAFGAFFSKADQNEIFWQKQGDLWRLLAAICINHLKREVEHYSAAKRNANLEQAIDLEIDGQLDGASNNLAELVESLVHDEKPLVSQVAQARLAGFTLAEIAEQTGRAERTVRRVLQMLKAKLTTQSTLNLEFHLDDGQAAKVKAQLAVQFKADYDNFDLLKMIDAGAFGKVYLARNKQTESLVAVKALRKAWLGDATVEGLLINEAQVLASLRHPHIIQFLDAGRLPNGSWFIVMEHANGTTFDKAIQTQLADSCEILNWLQQTCEALEFLHSKNVTHGDLKPANIIVCDRKNVQLIDFGFAQHANRSNPGWRGGTSGFIPPERSSSPAGDMFAFGRIIDFTIRHAASTLGKAEAPLSEIAEVVTFRDQSIRATASEIVVRLGKLRNDSLKP